MDKIIDTRSEEYRAGADDMWEYVKKVYDMTCTEMIQVFDGHMYIDDLLDNYTGTDVIEKLQAYEKIKVGDIISSDATKSSAIITYIGGFGQWYCINKEGVSFTLDKDDQQYWKRVGHNDEVIEELKRLEIQIDQ